MRAGAVANSLHDMHNYIDIFVCGDELGYKVILKQIRKN